MSRKNDRIDPADPARARDLPEGWRPEWRQPKQRNQGRRDAERAAKAAEPKERAINPDLRSRAIPTTGAPWLEQPIEGEPRQAIYRLLCEWDDMLADLGHRRLAPAWNDLLREWLCESNALTLTLRKGRRIGASTIIAPRLIAAWTRVVAPQINLPPGEIVVVGIVSVRRGEASHRIPQISAVLKAVGIEHVAKSHEIELVGAPVVIRVLTKNWRSAVGDNIGLLWCDEVSRWESEDSSANPASEVVSSLKPALATLQVLGFALMCLVSSPWSEDDYHAQQYARGNTEDQHIGFLPTWIGNPTLTEQQTHKLEPDERVWSREYGAIPGAMLSQALDSEDVNAAFGMVVPAGDLRRWCCIDASSLRGDAFAWMLGHEARGGLVVDRMEGFSDMSLRDLQLDTVVDEIAMACKARGIKVVWGDQREEAGLEVLFRQRGIVLETFAWTNPSKHDAFTYLRRLLRDRRMQLCEHADLQRQMRQCKARLMPSGLTSYETNGLDYLSTLVTLLHAYQRDWPKALAEILTGRQLPAPESAEDAQQRRNREDAERYLKQAQARAAKRAKAGFARYR